MISELASTATKLREVREAQEMFLSLWAMHRMTSAIGPLDRLAEDVACSGYLSSAAGAFEQFAGPNKSLWLLQRRRVLDD